MIESYARTHLCLEVDVDGTTRLILDVHGQVDNVSAKLFTMVPWFPRL